MPDSEAMTMRMLLGDYPGTRALKSGEIASPRVRLEFADVNPPNRAFKQVVRELAFDAAELAIVTCLQAHAAGKPLVVLPAVVLGRYQHPYLACDPRRGRLTPADLVGKRVGVRSHSVTTVAWLRGILALDLGVDIDRIRWIALEDGHVAEFRDPPEIERAAAGSDLASMLRSGEIDAAVLSEAPSPDSGLAPLFPDAQGEARDWCARRGVVPINHVVVVRESISRTRPEVVRELYRMLREAKGRAPSPPVGQPDMLPFGVEAMRASLSLLVEYCLRQRLIPRRIEVDEIFDDTTREL